MFSLKSFVVAAGLAAIADAHLTMRIPTPYTSPAIISSPLEPDGSNFPCQAKEGAEYSGTPTTMEKGSKQPLAFTGTVVHGGGSCQISITYDEKPNKNSSFKVLKSWQGGCPSRTENGNIEPADASAPTPDEYEFTIPSDIPSGKATIAWSWFNKVGNREMYMNCAPVEITGDGGSEAGLAALPDMLTANIGGTCATTADTDLEFPNPGSDVETKTEGQVNLAPPTGECAAAGGSGGSGSATAAPGGATPAVRGRHFRI